jgi:hypothetical protein
MNAIQVSCTPVKMFTVDHAAMFNTSRVIIAPSFDHHLQYHVQSSIAIFRMRSTSMGNI